MPRINVNCPCGWNFFVTDVAARQSVTCPSCGKVLNVRPPGGGAGGEAAPGDRKKLLLYAVGGGAVGLVILVVVAILVMGGEEPPPARPVTLAPTTQPERPALKVKVETAPKINFPEATREEPAKPSRLAPRTDLPKPSFQPPPLPADLVRELRDNISSLPPFYLGLAVTPVERGRMDALLKAGKAAGEDVDFLRGLLAAPALKIVREEMALLRDAYSKLEGEALGQLPVDRLVLTVGRAVDGNIVGETPDGVKFERRMGTGTGVTVYKRDQIKEVQKGKGVGVEFKTRWEAAKKGGVPERASLIAFCKENGLAHQQKLAAHLVLQSDPGHPGAREVAELSPNPIEAEKKAAAEGGWITHEGKKWTAVGLKEKLLRDGFVIFDGKWHARKERSLSVSNLMRHEKEENKAIQMVPSGVSVCQDVDVSYKPTYDPGAQGWKEVEERKVQRYFYAPPLAVSPIQTAEPGTQNIVINDRPDPAAGKILVGELTVVVPLGAPVVEASVLVRAETKPGGSIAVSVANASGQRVPLYEAKAREDSLRKVPDDAVRGQSQLSFWITMTMRAEYATKKERRTLQPLKRDGGRIIQPGIEVLHTRLTPDYRAVLFPSHSNTVEVFRCKATVAEPAEGLNKLFGDAGAMEVLTK